MILFITATKSQEIPLLEWEKINYQYQCINTPSKHYQDERDNHGKGKEFGDFKYNLYHNDSNFSQSKSKEIDLDVAGK